MTGLQTRNIFKAISIITCTSFLIMACGSSYRSRVYERPPESYTPTGQGHVSMHDPQTQQDAATCSQMQVQRGAPKRLPSGNICWVAPDGNQYLVPGQQYTQITSGNSRGASIDQNMTIDATTHVGVEVFGEGLDALDKAFLGLLTAAAVTLAVFIPVAADQGWFGSPTDVRVQTARQR